jgi:phage tail-like protein
MSAAAALLRPPPRPPHDPKWLSLDARSGWRLADASQDIEIAPADGALMLKQLSGAALTDPAGSFGGLVPPSHVTVDADGAVWLLDQASGLLKKFDCCCKEFGRVRCTAGIGKTPRELVAPGGISAFGPNILVADKGQPGRVLVFARHSLALRAIWRPPHGAWQPVAIACGAHAYVADALNGQIHVFDKGGHWRGAWDGFGAVAAIAADRCERIYTLVPGEPDVRLSDREGREIGRVSEAGAVAECFARLPFANGPDGDINLATLCDGAGWFDPSGAAIAPPTPVPPVFETSGVWVSEALDSRIARCVWHRLVLDGAIPPRTAIRFSTFTSEIEQPAEMIANLPEVAWNTVPGIAKDRDEALILSAPGRYMWLRATLTGRGHETPRIAGLKIEYPRITLRRYLPAVFGSDPVSADFSDRLLAIFDQGFRSVESKIDNEARMLDARSACAVSPGAGVPDMLSWLAGWIGIAFDATWPTARRRRFLREAAKLYRCRGTFDGIRGMLMLYLGIDALAKTPQAAACARGCKPAARRWRAPPFILEHWKIRRWMFLGTGRLGDAAELWGNSVMGRSQLDVNAQMGVTRLDTSRDPERDPFHAKAYAYTAFIPARFARTARERNALRRMIDGETPAYVQANLRFVEPRMRIGVQSSIGFDAVIGCWPEGVVLDSAALGRATVLSSGPEHDTGQRLGVTSRLAPSRIKRSSP